MNFTMTKLTKRLTITNLISKVFVVFPFFQVMSLQILCATAYLASVLISFDNSLTPGTIARGGTFFIAILCAHGIISAFFRAVLNVKVTVFGIKGLATKLTGEFGFCSTDRGVYGSTRTRAGNSLNMGSIERVTTNWTFSIVAIIAHCRARIIGFEILATYLAFVSREIFGNFCHAYNYTTISRIKRWVDMTGGEPMLL